MTFGLSCSLLGHDWSEWVEHSPGSCELSRVCRRCGAEERQQHERGEWEYRGFVGVGDGEHELPTEAFRSCRRCGVEESHQMSYW